METQPAKTAVEYRVISCEQEGSRVIRQYNSVSLAFAEASQRGFTHFQCVGEWDSDDEPLLVATRVPVSEEQAATLLEDWKRSDAGRRERAEDRAPEPKARPRIREVRVYESTEDDVGEWFDVVRQGEFLEPGGDTWLELEDGRLLRLFWEDLYSH